MFSAGQMFVSLAICLDFRKSALLDMFLHDQSRSGPFDAFCVSMALMVACVTGLNVFNILMLGPSDSGKTMLAKRISTVLPTLTSSESICNHSNLQCSGTAQARPTVDGHTTFSQPASYDQRSGACGWRQYTNSRRNQHGS